MSKRKRVFYRRGSYSTSSPLPISSDADGLSQRKYLKPKILSRQIIINILSYFLFLFFHYRLDNHLVTGHRYPAEQHICESCPRAYAWRPLLVRHRAIVHGDLRKYPCENCPKVSIISKLKINKISLINR